MLQLINLLFTKMFILHQLCVLKFQSLEHPQQMLQRDFYPILVMYVKVSVLITLSYYYKD